MREKQRYLLAAYPVYVKKTTISPEATAAKTPNVNDLSIVQLNPVDIKIEGHTKVTSLCLEPLIGPKDMCNQSKRNDLQDEMNRHCPRDEFPLTPPSSGSCCSLSYRSVIT